MAKQKKYTDSDKQMVFLGNTLIRSPLYPASDSTVKAYFILAYMFQESRRKDGIVQIQSDKFLEMMGFKDSSYKFRRLKNIAEGLQAMNADLYEERMGGFVNMFSSAFYNGDIFQARFTQDMMKFIQAEKPYTALQMEIILGFSKTRYKTTALLYAYLRSFAFRIDEEDGYIDVYLDNEDLHRQLSIMEGKDTAATKNFHNFMNRHIAPAVAQINERSDIHVEMIVQQGSHRKAVGITFRTSWQKKPEIVVDEKLEAIREKLNDVFSPGQVEELVLASGHDADILERAYQTLQGQKDNQCILSPYAYLIACIRTDAQIKKADEAHAAKLADKESPEKPEKQEKSRKSVKNA